MLDPPAGKTSGLLGIKCVAGAADGSGIARTRLGAQLGGSGYSCKVKTKNWAGVL